MFKEFFGSEKLEILDGNIIDINYYLTKENVYFEELCRFEITYGIQIEIKDKEIELVRNITSDREKIYRILEIMKRNKVLPVHLHDVVEDLL